MTGDSIDRADTGTAVTGTVERTADDVLTLVTHIWSSVLGADDVGPTDDFYSLGGHSLTALRITYRLRQELSVRIALQSLLDSPRLDEFARLVWQAVQSPGAAPAGRPPLVRRDSRS